MLQFSDYFLIFMAAFCIIRGLITVFTGNIPEGEAQYIGRFTEDGLKRYKILSAVINIAGGVFISGLFCLKFFNIINGLLFTVTGVGGAILMLVVFLAVRKSCGKVGFSA